MATMSSRLGISKREKILRKYNEDAWKKVDPKRRPGTDIVSRFSG